MLSSKVKEIMNREVLTAQLSEPVWSVMERMKAKKVGRMVIVDQGEAVGIFTEKDVLKRVVSQKVDAKKTRIGDVMTRPIQSVYEDAHMVEVLGKMYQGKFRHMLVRKAGGGLAGLVSMRRILKLAVELGRDLTETRTIGSIMSKDPVKLDPSRPVGDAIDAMARHDASSVLVMGERGLGGIFTERDVLTRIANRDVDIRQTAVEHVMTPNPVTLPDSALIGTVLSTMYERGVRNMPLHGEDGAISGLVSITDVLKYAQALDVDESVRKAWREIREYWDSKDQYTPG